MAPAAICTFRARTAARASVAHRAYPRSLSASSQSKAHTILLRVPIELKARLEEEAEHQGISVDPLATYFLTTQLTQLEALAAIESRISRENISKFKPRVKKILGAVPKTANVPDWDAIKHPSS